MSVYFGYRDLEKYFFQMTLCGGPPINPDDRLTTVKESIYLLTFTGKDYAVTPERAQKFMDEVLSKTTGSHDGRFPKEKELNGKKTAAVIEISDENGTRWYDFDDQLMLRMLTELKDECGGPLCKRDLINYTNPNPELPEDFELKTIYHQRFCGPDDTPVTCVRTAFPDTETSHFWTDNGKAYVVIREGITDNKFCVPDELIPGIKERVKELCKDPVGIYVDPGEYEGYIQFGKTKKQICTDPNKTLELLKYIASKSVFESKTEIDTNKFYPYGSAPANAVVMRGSMGMFMNGQSQNQVPSMNAVPAARQPASSASETWDCPSCGNKGNTANFCPECGTLKPDTWTCPMCKKSHNAGKFCMECGFPKP